MLLALACLLAAAAAAPAVPAAPLYYDQRQDGDFNVQADVQNVVLLVAIPKQLPLDFMLDMFSKNAKDSKWDSDQDLQDRSDHVMEAFVEPSTPYRVEIGAAERSASDARAAEVVIAGRRRLEAEAQELDELKLLGATENCGPERMRDPDTLMCKAVKATVEAKPATDKENKVESEQTPEVVSS